MWRMGILYSRLKPFAFFFLILQTLVRITLIARAWGDIDQPILYVPKALAVGFWFDLTVLSFLVLPFVFYWLALPTRLHGSRFDVLATRVAFGLFCFIMVFSGVSEHIFWDEFGVRFNFIAVDYLIYTNEVLGNIYESYPVVPLISGMALFCALLTWLMRFRLTVRAAGYSFNRRAVFTVYMVTVAAICYGLTSIRMSDISRNTYTNEISANGIYNLFWAYGHNEIDYKSFYLTHDEGEVDKRIRGLLEEKNAAFVSKDTSDITRIIHAQRPEIHRNVIFVVMESMSGDYMGKFGNTGGYTPNLDALADQGLFFTNHYATGTRTVRGLEAITLSVPPTPGQSIVRRPGNENLFSTGFLFKDRGYDTAFIYGGYGYFDNMNYFYQHNGFDIIDRNVMPKEDIHFGNVWGVSDEDLFEEVIKQADQSYAKQKPFFHTVMTTSNHRPYTYPEGRIDIPSGKNRIGGVKYADYAVGRLVAEAKKKPWFKNTLFVFVADHTAGASGKVELSQNKYHIPLIMYAPDFIKPQKFTGMASQIDIAPTVLGMLGFTYRSRFYGRDLLVSDDEPRAFISNYQKVALIKRGQTTILAPKRKLEAIVDDKIEQPKILLQDNIDDAVAYYQNASGWQEHSRRIDSRATK